MTFGAISDDAVPTSSMDFGSIANLIASGTGGAILTVIVEMIRNK